MDQLTIMRSFVGVTKSRSFSQAARTLGISGSLVSRHVAEFERALGVHLVNRTARTISLTEAGVRYAEFASRMLAMLLNTFHVDLQAVEPPFPDMRGYAKAAASLGG